LPRKHFILISTVILIIVLSLNSIATMRKEQRELYQILTKLDEDVLEQQLSENGTVSEQPLTENLESLKIVLQEKLEYLEEIEKEKKQLQEILSLRYENYYNAVEVKGDEVSVLTPSGFSTDMLENAWESLQADELEGTGGYFIKAEQKTGVNALILASIAVHESNFGRSALAQEKNNLFGFGAFYFGPFEHALEFETKKEGILYISDFIKDHYLKPGGEYYKGDTLSSMNIYYAEDEEWSDKVARTMSMIARAAVEEEELSLWKKHLQ